MQSNNPIFNNPLLYHVTCHAVPTHETLQKANRDAYETSKKTRNDQLAQKHHVLDTNWVTLQKEAMQPTNKEGYSKFTRHVESLINIIIQGEGNPLPSDLKATYTNLANTLKARYRDSAAPMLLTSISQFAHQISFLTIDERNTLCSIWPGSPPPACLPGYNESLTQLMTGTQYNPMHQKIIAINQKNALSLSRHLPPSMHIHATSAISSITTVPDHEIKKIDPYYSAARKGLGANMAYEIMERFNENITAEFGRDLETMLKGVYMFARLNHQYVYPNDPNLSHYQRGLHQNVQNLINESPVLALIAKSYEKRSKESNASTEDSEFNPSEYVHTTLLEYNEETKKMVTRLATLVSDYNRALHDHYQFSQTPDFAPFSTPFNDAVARANFIPFKNLFKHVDLAGELVVNDFSSGNPLLIGRSINILYALSGPFIGKSLPLATALLYSLGGSTNTKHSNPMQTSLEGLKILANIPIDPNSILLTKRTEIIVNMKEYITKNQGILSFICKPEKPIFIDEKIVKQLLRENAPLSMLSYLNAFPALSVNITQLPYHPQYQEIVELYGKNFSSINFTLDEHKRFILNCCLNNTPELLELINKFRSNLLQEVIDTEGNTPAHIAAELDQIDIINVLIQHFPLNSTNQKGDTPLAIALKKNHLSIALTLINSSKTNLKLKDAEGNAPVHIAARLGQVNIIYALIEKDMVGQYNNAGDSALNIAIRHNQEDVTDILLDLNKNDLIFHYTLEGDTPAHLAAKYNNYDTIKSLKKTAIIQTPNQNTGKTPLIVAIESGHNRIAKSILKLPSTNLDTADKQGLTPTHWAVKTDNLEILKLAVSDKILSTITQHPPHPLSIAIERDNKKTVSYILNRNTTLENKLMPSGNTFIQQAITNNKLNALQAFIDLGAINSRNKDNKTPISIAISENKTECLRALLSSPAIDTDTANTALLHVAEKGSSETINQLLNHPKININHQDNQQNTAIFLAANNKQSDVLSSLLQSPSINLHHTNSSRSNILHILSSSMHQDLIPTVLQKSPSLINSQQHEGDTPLHLAAAKGNVSTMAVLLQNNDIDVNKINNKYETALLKSAYAHKTESMVLLLKQPNIDVNSLDLDGKNPLLVSAQIGNTEGVLALISHPDIEANIIDAQGKNALQLAAENNHVKTVSSIIQNTSIDVNYAEPTAGNTALFEAVKKNNEPMIRELLKAPNIRLRELNDFGESTIDFAKNTPYTSGQYLLRKAALQGDNDTVKELIAARRDLSYNINVNDNGDSLLAFLIEQGNLPLIQSALAQPDTDINLENTKGDTPLIIAAKKNDLDAMTLLLNNAKILVNHYNKEKLTALSAAIVHGNPDAALTILTTKTFNKINFNNMYYQVNQVGETALHLAIKHGYNQIADLLLEMSDSDINKRRFDGDTPLFIAVKHNNLHATQRLLEFKKIQVNKSNNLGDTPLITSINNNNLEITRALLDSSHTFNWKHKNKAGISALSALNSGNRITSELKEFALQHPKNAPSESDFLSKVNKVFNPMKFAFGSK